MKLTLYYCVFLLFLLLLSFSSSRPIITKQGLDEVSLNGKASEDSLMLMEASSELFDVMDSDVCQSDDEECFNRRMALEAHLDYIYTQHHKP